MSLFAQLYANWPNAEFLRPFGWDKPQSIPGAMALLATGHEMRITKETP